MTGETICNDPPVDVTVSEIIVHENYQPSSKNQHHDIALLRLSRSVAYTDFIKPICLPLDSSVQGLNLDGTTLVVSGWGQQKIIFRNDPIKPILIF